MMKIFVKAKPSAKCDRIERIDASHATVWVRAPAKGGRANAAIEQSLADYLNIPPSRVRVTKGFTSSAKVVEMNMELRAAKLRGISISPSTFGRIRVVPENL